MNDENLKVEEMEDEIDVKVIEMPRFVFLGSMIAVFLLGMLFAIGINWFIPAQVPVVSASTLTSMSVDELDEYYNNREIRVVGATVDHISSGNSFLVTDVGSVFFKDEDDIFKVREGETFTFKGRFRIDNTGSIIFHQSEFISLKEEEK